MDTIERIFAKFGAFAKLYFANAPNKRAFTKY
jgi:hypothetical protein